MGNYQSFINKQRTLNILFLPYKSWLPGLKMYMTALKKIMDYKTWSPHHKQHQIAYLSKYVFIVIFI